MHPRERFQRTLNFERCDDRLPMVEWAAWWDLTLDRWKQEGMPPEASWEESLAFFGLDPLPLIGTGGGPGSTLPPEIPRVVTDDASYDALRPYLFTDEGISRMLAEARRLQAGHARGDFAIRLWLDGYFWFPRGLMGIEPHMLAFYDQPELMHRMNRDLAAYNVRVMEAVCTVLTPDLVGFAEDMSYNHGPMLSEVFFGEFLRPYYDQTVPVIHRHGSKALVDTDGDVTTMIPWLLAAGLDGVYPLERQAGVDIVRLRAMHPRLLMMGGFDKMTMTRGEDAMRAEFERLLPVMRSGGYIPSVDHQTPPGVSLAAYQVYVRLFRAYCERAAR